MSGRTRIRRASLEVGRAARARGVEAIRTVEFRVSGAPNHQIIRTFRADARERRAELGHAETFCLRGSTCRFLPNPADFAVVGRSRRLPRIALRARDLRPLEDMSHLTVINVQRDAAPAVFDLLRDAQIASDGFAAIDARGDATLKARFADIGQREMPGVGTVDVAGDIWDREAQAGEGLADFLFRHGLGRDAASRVENDVGKGAIAVVVTDPQIDVQGVKLALEREARAEVLEAEAPRGTAESRVPEGTRAEVREGDVRGFARGGTRSGTP